MPTTTRIYNFSAGPAVLPLPVLQEAQRDLIALPEDEAKRVMTEASMYAGMKLAEVEARAHFVRDIHSEE